MNEQEVLTKKQAIELLGLDEKIFDNYFKLADEFQHLERVNNRGRFKFDKNELLMWQKSYKWRSVELDLEDYSQCLDFALAQHIRGYVMSDWGTGRQREFGQKITNWVKGQLAEVAFKKFLKNEFSVEVVLDFDLHEDIVPQDVIGITENSKTRDPKIGIGIKSSKSKNAYLILSSNEVVLPERKSEVYVFCRPNIPDDHLLRVTREKIISLVENQQHYPSYENSIPVFENINCEIAGWCKIDELEEVTSIPGQDFDGVRFVKKTGNLHRSKDSWEQLIGLL